MGFLIKFMFFAVTTFVAMKICESQKMDERIGLMIYFMVVAVIFLL